MKLRKIMKAIRRISFRRKKVYTIGKDCDFASIKDAISHLMEDGKKCDVILEIKKGGYL